MLALPDSWTARDSVRYWEERHALDGVPEGGMDHHKAFLLFECSRVGPPIYLLDRPTPDLPHIPDVGRLYAER